MVKAPNGTPMREAAVVVVHGWAIVLIYWDRHLENRWTNSELFYVLGHDCPSMLW